MADRECKALQFSLSLELWLSPWDMLDVGLPWHCTALFTHPAFKTLRLRTKNVPGQRLAQACRNLQACAPGRLPAPSWSSKATLNSGLDCCFIHSADQASGGVKGFLRG
eukprot:119778-Pelagomonas_calceolata.AAC.3